MKETVNPYMITIAREAKNKTQLKLSGELNIKQARLSKIESGIAPIDEELLSKLAANLEFPIEFFYEPYTPVDTEYKLHRKQCALKRDELSYISSNTNIIDMHIGKLLNSIEIDNNIPEKINLDYLDTPEEVAIALREYLSIPKGPVWNVTNIIESLGIFIINFDYPDTKFDGVSFYNKKNVPVIVVNKNLAPDRDRFTKTHEFGHTIMHKFPSPDAEGEANRFAAEFLMPKKDIIEDLENLSFYSLPTLKRKWNVSMAALIYRAKTLKTISESREKSLWSQMSRAKYRKTEPDMGLTKEKTELFKNVLEVYQKNFGYSYDELVKYFSINKKHYEFLYEEGHSSIKIKSHLRLIENN